MIYKCQIYNKIKLWKLNYDIDIIYLDYLDKIDHNFTKGGVKTYAMQDTMNWLSRSAKECDIPFIMLAQIDRNADKKGDITNFVLADLSDSKSVEQESYTVSFIVRPEKYGETKYTTSSGQEIDAKGLAVLNVTKNRGGKTGKLLLNFTDYCTLFENYQMPTEDEPKKIKHYNENEDESAF